MRRHHLLREGRAGGGDGNEDSNKRNAQYHRARSFSNQ
jgi:hypothetical protein